MIAYTHCLMVVEGWDTLCLENIVSKAFILFTSLSHCIVALLGCCFEEFNPVLCSTSIFKKKKKGVRYVWTNYFQLRDVELFRDAAYNRLALFSGASLYLPTRTKHWTWKTFGLKEVFVFHCRYTYVCLDMGLSSLWVWPNVLSSRKKNCSINTSLSALKWMWKKLDLDKIWSQNAESPKAFYLMLQLLCQTASL